MVPSIVPSVKPSALLNVGAASTLLRLARTSAAANGHVLNPALYLTGVVGLCLRTASGCRCCTYQPVFAMCYN